MCLGSRLAPVRLQACKTIGYYTHEAQVCGTLSEMAQRDPDHEVQQAANTTLNMICKKRNLMSI